MQQNFALQTQFSNCCCENRLATANLASDIAREACADRQAVSDALASVLNTMNNGIQSIKDQMCQDKIDAKNELIANLRQQMNMMQLQASQNAQTQALIANNDLQTAALEQYLAPVPRPAYVVQNPNCCGQNLYNGCGCGM
jgi:vacuolar-type H+-ATPase catalytic subunit A/Vma1